MARAWSCWSTIRSYARQSVVEHPHVWRRSYGVAYFAAGGRIDGGIRLYALDVKTGELLHKADVRVTGGRGANVIRQSVLPDILSIENDTVWMRGLGVNKNLAPVPDEPHLFAPRGFLDDTWWHRTYWVYGTKIGGGYSHWPDAGNAVPAGRLLVFDGGKHIYGYGRLRYRMGDGHVGRGAASDYTTICRDPRTRATEPGRSGRCGTRERRTGEPVGRRQIEWVSQLPFVAQFDRADHRCTVGCRRRVTAQHGIWRYSGNTLDCFPKRRGKAGSLPTARATDSRRHGLDRLRCFRLHDRRGHHLPANKRRVNERLLA